eukprot:COSAG04_NODE_12224_length_664_cov_0.874336_1_plen_177_part_01
MKTPRPASAGAGHGTTDRMNPIDRYCTAKNRIVAEGRPGHDWTVELAKGALTVAVEGNRVLRSLECPSLPRPPFCLPVRACISLGRPGPLRFDVMCSCSDFLGLVCKKKKDRGRSLIAVAYCLRANGSHVLCVNPLAHSLIDALLLSRTSHRLRRPCGRLATSEMAAFPSSRLPVRG